MRRTHTPDHVERVEKRFNPVAVIAMVAAALAMVFGGLTAVTGAMADIETADAPQSSIDEGAGVGSGGATSTGDDALSADDESATDGDGADDGQGSLESSGAGAEPAESSAPAPAARSLQAPAGPAAPAVPEPAEGEANGDANGEDGSTCAAGSGRDITTLAGAGELNTNNVGTNTIFTKAQLTDPAGKAPAASADLTTGFSIAYKWALNDSLRAKMKACDYFTFKLPDGFVPNTPQAGQLLDGDGKVVGQYTVDENGNGRITFGDYVTTKANISGDLNVQSRIDTDYLDKNGTDKVPNPFPGEGGVTDIPVTKDDANYLDKKVGPNSLRNGDPLNWDGRWAGGKIVDYPFEWVMTVNEAGRTMSNPVVTENYPKTVNAPDDIVGMKVEEGFWDAANQRFVVERELTEGSDFTVTGTGNTQQIQLPDNTRKMYRITVKTRVMPAQLDEYASTRTDDKGNTIPEAIISNEATLDTGTHQPTTSNAEQKYTYQASLQKKQTSYDPATGVIGWSVTYKHGSKFALPKGFTMNDTVRNASYTDADGNPITMQQLAQLFTDQAGVAIDVSAKGGDDKSLNLAFPDGLKKSFTITYYTKVADPKASVSIVGNKFTAGDQWTDKGAIPTGEGIKSIQPGDNQGKAIDFKDKTVAWSTTVAPPADKGEYGWWKMNDEITGGTLPNPFNVTVTDVDDPSRTLTQGKDYCVDVTSTVAGRTKFQVTMPCGASGDTSKRLTGDAKKHTYKVDYVTAFDPTKETVSNYARVSYPEYGDESFTEGTDGFDPQDFGQVAITKDGTWKNRGGYAEWTITVPEQETPFGRDAQIVDFLQEGWLYVDGSAQVTGPDGKPADNITVTPAKGTNCFSGKTNACERLTFTGFPEGGFGPYTITLRTTIPESSDAYGEKTWGVNSGGQGWVSNHAQYTDRDHQPSVGTKGMNYFRDNDTLSKTGSIDEATRVLSYKVVFNSKPDAGPMSDVTLKDQPFGMELLPDTFKVLANGTGDDVCGTAGVTCTVDAGGYTVVFTGDVTQKYVVTYDAKPLVDGDYVYNNVTADGNGVTSKNTNDRTKILVPTDQSGGSASGGVYGFTFQKNDEAGNPLPGASFLLERQKAGENGAEPTWEPRSTRVSGDDGTVAFNNLTPGTFRVTEVKAPSGYALPTNPTFTIVLSSEDGDQLDASCQPVPGAPEIVRGIVKVTDANGVDQPVIGTLADGTTYNSCAVQGGDGHVLAHDGTKNFRFLVGTPVANQKTQLTVTKNWADNDNAGETRPDSIQVKLLADGSEVATGGTQTLNDDNDWTCTWTGLPQYKADGTAEIKYTVQEVLTAPNKGYYEDPVIDYSSGSADGLTVTRSEPENTAIITNTVKDQQFRITKVSTVKDSQGNGKPLAGAEFTLYALDAKGDRVEPGTVLAATDDGGLTSASVVPGTTYELVETKTPQNHTTKQSGVDSMGTYQWKAGALQQVTPGASSSFDGATDPATVTVENAPYFAAPNEYQLEVTKSLFGDSPLPAGKSYTFDWDITLAEWPSKANTDPALANPSNDLHIANGQDVRTIDPQTGAVTPGLSVTMDALTNGQPDREVAVLKGISFHNPGMYTFTVKEKDPGKREITADPNPLTITYNVKIDDQTNMATVTDVQVKKEKSNGQENEPVQQAATGSNNYTVAFRNLYAPAPAKLTPDVSKRVVAANGATGVPDQDFTFAMTKTAGPDKGFTFAEPDDAAASPQTKTVTLKSKDVFAADANTAKVAFGEMTFTIAGDYEFAITEQSAAADGWTFDPADTITMKVSITTDDDGNLVPSAPVYTHGDGADSVFTNTFTPKPVPFTPAANKGLTLGAGIEATPDQTFSFTLKTAEGSDSPYSMAGTQAEVSETATVKSTDVDPTARTGATVQFGEIVFDHAGTYTFDIVEDGADQAPDGWTYDASPVTLTVIVSSDDNGNLVINDGDVTYVKDGAKADAAAFANRYAPGEVPFKPEISKSVVVNGTGDAPKQDFSFTLKPGPANKAGAFALVNNADSETKVTDSAIVSTDPTVAFGEITFSEPGVYTFSIDEDASQVPENWNYDPDSQVLLTVKVTDDGAGRLVAAATYDKAGATSEKAEFTNTYTPPETPHEPRTPGKPNTPKKTLATTGAQVLGFATAAAALTGAGWLLIAAGKRRKED